MLGYLLALIFSNAGIILGTLITAYIIWEVLRILRRPAKLPPGPMGYPLIGAIPNLSGAMHLDLLRFGKEYNSDIISFYIGRRLYIGLNKHQDIMDAYMKQSTNFAGRPDMIIQGLVFYDDEIFTKTYSEKWREHKKFSTQALRYCGFGTKESELKIQREVDNVIQHLQENEGKPVDLEDILKKSFAGVMLNILYNKEYSWNDPEKMIVVDSFLDMFDVVDEAPLANNLDRGVYPDWLLYLFWGKYFNKVKSRRKPLKAYVEKMIKEHKETFDPNHIRDTLDYYIKYRGDDPDLAGELFTGTMSVLMPDAIDTLGNAITWTFLHLAYHPEKQKKVRDEIKKFCGDSRHPTLDDRPDLRYTEACILEGFRMGSVFALAFPHHVMEDTVFKGHFIPKDASILANLYAVHNDTDLFENPKEYSPERHFDEEGHLVKTDNVLPFGVGKRMCIADHMSRMKAFLFVSNLLQQFEFSFPENEPKPSREPMVGQTLHTVPFKVIAKSV